MLSAKVPTANTIAGTKWYQVSIVIRHTQPPKMSAEETKLQTTISRTEDLYLAEVSLQDQVCCCHGQKRDRTAAREINVKNMAREGRYLSKASCTETNGGTTTGNVKDAASNTWSRTARK